MSQDVTLWLGTQTAHDLMLEAVEKYTAKVKSGDPFSDMLPPLLQVDDGVGVISVSGPLVTGSAGFMRLFGLTGYDDIAGALVEGVSNKAVHSIVLNISSDGGHAGGVQDLGKLIANVNRIKPVYAQTGDMMMSAAYWLGVSARKVYSAETAEVGSIGVLITVMDRSEMYKKEGITPHVIRGGKFKALANGLEPLSDAAKASLQKKADTLHHIFLTHVASRRGGTAASVKASYGEGQTYLGEEATEIGAVDGVKSFPDVLALAKSAKP